MTGGAPFLLPAGWSADPSRIWHDPRTGHAYWLAVARRGPGYIVRTVGALGLTVEDAFRQLQLKVVRYN